MENRIAWWEAKLIIRSGRYHIAAKKGKAVTEFFCTIFYSTVTGLPEAVVASSSAVDLPVVYSPPTTGVSNKPTPWCTELYLPYSLALTLSVFNFWTRMTTWANHSSAALYRGPFADHLLPRNIAQVKLSRPHGHSELSRSMNCPRGPLRSTGNVCFFLIICDPVCKTFPVRVS